MSFQKIVIVLLLVVIFNVPASAQLTSMRTVLDKDNAPARTRPRDDAPAFKTLTTGGPTGAECDGDDGTGLFPTSNPAVAPCFWQQQGFEWLSGAEMTGSGGSVAATTEVLSDFLGGWRVSFATSVASPADDDPEPGEDPVAAEAAADQQTATNLLQANGGNLALAAAYPLYAYTFKGINGGFAAVTYGRAAGTFDAFGDLGPTGSQSFEVSELNANVEWAVTTKTRVVTLEKKFDVELMVNGALFAGTKPFRTALGIDTNDAGVFGHFEAGVNFRLGGTMVIGASYNHYTASGLDSGATLTVGFVPPKPPAE